MRRSLALLCLAIAACAGPDGAWPSLARRPGEVAAMVPRPSPAAASATTTAPAPAPASAATPVPVGDVGAQLNTIDRDLTDLATRVTAQRGVAERAVAAARGTKSDSEAAATAQLEMTRFERVGSQIADQRGRLDALAGRLAAAAAGGTDVAALLRQAGGLIARSDTLDRAYQAAHAAASDALPR